MIDYVIEILEGYLEFEKLKVNIDYNNLSWDKKRDLRLEFDNDAAYFYRQVGLKREEALKADTIISFWTPYKRLVELKTGLKYYRTVKSLTALISQIKATWKNESTPKLQIVNKNISEFAKVYYTKGNYMLLPNSKMNIQRYNVAEDRIDWSLYECFDKGVLAKFFKTNDSLSSWIKKEKLDSLFFNGEISKEKIQWFTSEDKTKLISEMGADEIYEYLNNAIILIKKRNN